jgi:hypothetical protein
MLLYQSNWYIVFELQFQIEMSFIGGTGWEGGALGAFCLDSNSNTTPCWEKLFWKGFFWLLLEETGLFSYLE